MKKIVIFGTSTFAEVVSFYLKHDSKFEISAYTANKEHIKLTEFNNCPVIPFEEITQEYPPEKYDMFIAIAYQKTNQVRAKIFSEAKEKGYKLISYVNSKVIKWGELDIGENCFIFENVVIQPFVKIGNDVIIWSGDHIGHHTTINDHCFITSHVVISGNVTVGEYSFLGVNSTIRDGIKIGKKNVIGAGSVILKDTEEGDVFTTNATTLLPIKSDKLNRI
jgi:sugar O-acyltransferase (sialic acid O-acetyltransferase NeuD family)